MAEESRIQRSTPTTSPILRARLTPCAKHATLGLLIVIFSGIHTIGNLRVAYRATHTSILLHWRGDPMTLSDRIERTMVLPAPRQRVWEASTKPEQLAHWFGVVSDMDFRVGGAIHFTWENEPCPYTGRIEVNWMAPPTRKSMHLT